MDVYPVEKELYIPDLPNTIITIKDFGKRKSIIDNHHAPKELKDFEFYLESQFQKLEFIKIGRNRIAVLIYFNSNILLLTFTSI